MAVAAESPTSHRVKSEFKFKLKPSKQ